MNNRSAGGNVTGPLAQWAFSEKSCMVSSLVSVQLFLGCVVAVVVVVVVQLIRMQNALYMKNVHVDKCCSVIILELITCSLHCVHILSVF